jgi:GTPase SAR1 family protein
MTDTATEPVEGIEAEPTKEPEPTGNVPATAPTDEILETLLSKFTDLSSPKNNFKLLVTGEPDAGKTTFAGTAPNNLFIDTEDGTTSLLNHPEILGANSKRYPYKSFEGLEILVRYLQEGNPAFDWVQVVTLDSATNLHKRGLREVVERDWKRSPSTVNRYKAETDHHTENNERMRRLVDDFKNLDRDIILLAHSRIVEPKNKDAKTFPDFSEKLANAIMSLVDIGVYIEKRKVEDELKRVFRFRTDSTIMTKCRVDSLPDEAVDVTWPQIKKAWDEHQLKASKK